MLKYRKTGIAAAALSAALLLSACGGAAGNNLINNPESENNYKPDEYIITDGGANNNASNSASNASNNASSGANSASNASNSAVNNNSAVFTDVFSSRDLSGTWDASEAVNIDLNGAAINCDSNNIEISGTVAKITAAGVYVISGKLDNGYIIIDAGTTDKVQIVLNNAEILSNNFAAIYIKQADKVFITLAENSVNTLSNGGNFEQIDDKNIDGVIYARDDVTFNGGGKLIINSPVKHGIVSKDELVFTGGEYEITATGHAISGKDAVGIANAHFNLTSGKDGIQADYDDNPEKGNLYIASGEINIQAGDDGISASGILQIDSGNIIINAHEGIEARYIKINNGNILVNATDDGINATKETGYACAIEINGGNIQVSVGQGDTDCIDSNGDLIITGGVIDVKGPSGFDIDGQITFTGGTVTINGEQVDTIPTQMMGGRGGRGGMMGGGAFGGTPGQNPNFGGRGGMMGGTPGQNPGRPYRDDFDDDDDDYDDYDDHDDDDDDDDDYDDDDHDDDDDDDIDNSRDLRMKKGGKIRGARPGKNPDAVTSPTTTVADI